MILTTLNDLIDRYKAYKETEHKARQIIEMLKVEVANRKTEIAAEVLGEVDENGKSRYPNEFSRRTEIDLRAMRDEKIIKWQEQIWQAEREEREARREAQGLYWQIEARIHSPQVI